jgi:hypothetical protein
VGVPAAALRTNSFLGADDPPKLLLSAADNQSRTQLIEDIKENVMAWIQVSHPQVSHPHPNPLPKGEGIGGTTAG